MKDRMGIFLVTVVLGLACGAGAAPTLFVVPLDGFQEVPGPGDSDGTGTAQLTIDPDTQTIDWNIATDGIIDFRLLGAHIHQAPAGEAGPIVVDFNRQLSGVGLVDADLAAILANPGDYYVNVHNWPFRAGAIRGQLGTEIPAPSGTEIPAPSALGLLVFGLLSLRLSRRKPA